MPRARDELFLNICLLCERLNGRGDASAFRVDEYRLADPFSVSALVRRGEGPEDDGQRRSGSKRLCKVRREFFGVGFFRHRCSGKEIEV